MARSALYTANTASQTVAINGTISPGTIIRRFGQCCNLSGSGITINGTGYYSVNISVTATPTAEGTVTVSLYKDGVAVPGATASGYGSDDVNLSINALVREACACNPSSVLTLVISESAAVISNVACVVEKL